ncbi:Amidase 1 [Trichoderma lentiforme]|uniref:Amidase 1 n=1 Tax=Trichoderma lentiforme TaxID=1567552 RepID=A0A9P4XAF5_9HYPO|nr:Amidase 1 [Trichoderma lentiforme]
MAGFTLSRLVALLTLATTTAGQITSTGATVKLGQLSYFINPHQTGTIPRSSLNAISHVPSAFGFTPITVVATATNPSDLNAVLTNWTSIDDVFQAGFAQVVFLAGQKSSSTQNLLGTNATVAPLDTSDLPSGPYFVDSAGSAYRAYRLYDDFVGAFAESLLQKPDGTFETLSAKISSSATMSIGVPSRLYFTRTKEKPLAGVRIGVKDLFDLSGVKKSNGNRAWYHFYPEAKKTAPAIQNLIDAGAVIVGQQIPAQFAQGGTATADWIDYHAPFNPRGDGYNDAGGSSTGGGASIAAYDWLDLAVGTDTGGSIRGPAAEGGVFGNRPSWGSVSADGCMPLSPTMDTIGFLTRDPTLWDAAQAALYQSKYTSYAGETAIKWPKKIYNIGGWPDPADPTPLDDLTQTLVDIRAKIVELTGSELHVTEIADEWIKTRPKAAQNANINEVLDRVYTTKIEKDVVRLVREPFYADYSAKHNGALPAVDPANTNRWDFADQTPDSELVAAETNRTMFRDWLQSELLTTDNETCSSAIIIYATVLADPVPRNVYLSPPKVNPKFSLSRIAPFAEVPDFAIPVGEFEANSTITNHTQKLPLGLGIMVAKGCDGVLTRLAQDMVKSGIIGNYKAGGTMEGGEVLFK